MPDTAAGRAVELHARYRGKIQMMPKCPVRSAADFAVWYTPGVAEACRAIVADPARIDDQTNRANTIAVVSDGSRILGLGDIGPAAGLPVMEGKALLFKYLGGVDAVPLCIRAADEDDIVATVEAIQPSFGAINLEDISQPKCFRVLDRLRASLDIPVWHDDQQGTATVLLAGLTNALKAIGKPFDGVRIAMVGVGAANVAVYRLLTAKGIDPGAIVACDSKGTLHSGRADIEAAQEEYAEKWRICSESNAAKVSGGIAEALAGADVCIAFSRSGPGVIDPAWVAGMADKAVIFACANPVPEIWPEDARAAGAAVVATGRSDFANQVNNSLGFPGIFRGVLDVEARTISDGMAMAAAAALAAHAEKDAGFGPERILAPMDDVDAVVEVAAATGLAAQAEGIAGREMSEDALREAARTAIETARAGADALFAGKD